jgi:hypothetical protein
VRTKLLLRFLYLAGLAGAIATGKSALAMVVFGIAVFALLVYLVTRRRPIRPGFCLSCGYDLTGNVSGTCPECGGKVG